LLLRVIFVISSGNYKCGGGTVGSVDDMSSTVRIWATSQSQLHGPNLSNNKKDLIMFLFLNFKKKIILIST